MLNENVSLMSVFLKEIYLVAEGFCPPPSPNTKFDCGKCKANTPANQITAYQYGNIFITKTFANDCELTFYNCGTTGPAYVQSLPIVPCPTALI